MADARVTASGVEELIRRLHEEGVERGEKEQARIVSRAQSEAAMLLDSARAQAAEIVAAARLQADADRRSAREAVRLAHRDALLQLRQDLEALFGQLVRRLVKERLDQRDALAGIVDEVARSAIGCGLRGVVGIELAGPHGDPGPSAPEVLDAHVSALVVELLTHGIEMHVARSNSAGVRVRLEGGTVEVDISPDSVSAMLLDRLLPRYRSLLQEDARP
ncbi:MAG: hypothetical protein JNL33_17200 [Betaproteobacteria bacterium]|nr:hypothetical protein [Betaproteobacteria bacterium]